MWQEHEHGDQRQRDWNELDGENWEVDSRDKVRHTERRSLRPQTGKAQKGLIARSSY